LSIYGESKYIHGIHEPGGEFLIEDPLGWIIFTHKLGHDPSHRIGFDYAPWANRGFGIIARLNNGYGNDGTIPLPGEYINFAKRCANWVQFSRGCHLWIIGNEPNHIVERPDGIEIAPEDYAVCFTEVRKRIHEVSPQHKVIVAAVAPWYFPPDWIEYQTRMLNAIQTFGGADGISLHTYTHGPEPWLITNEDRMDPPFEDRRYHFRAYRDMIVAFPQSMRELPIYITETDQNAPWLNINSGWCVEAVQEIDEWNNLGGQPVACLAFYRWPKYDMWYIDGKENLYRDIQNAVALRVERVDVDEGENEDNPEPDPEPSPDPDNGEDNMTVVWSEDFDGEWICQDGIAEVRVPARNDGTVLRAFWYMGDIDDFGDKSYVQPEIEKESGQAYPYRVMSGTGSWNQFNSYNLHYGGGYCQPKCIIGAEYRFSIYGHMWTAGSVHGSPPVSDGDPYNCQSFLALGPQGQTDLFAVGVVVGEHHWFDAWDNYIEYTIDFVAQSEHPTIFWVARFKHPVQNNNAFWDMARLYQMSDTEPGPGPGGGITAEQAKSIARIVAQEEIERVISAAMDAVYE